MRKGGGWGREDAKNILGCWTQLKKANSPEREITPVDPAAVLQWVTCPLLDCFHGAVDADGHCGKGGPVTGT